MDERIVQFRVGVTVLAALIVTGILVLLFGELPALVRGTYAVYIKFPSAPGVAQDTPVRKSGILIGRVSKVQFAPDNEVLVTANIDGGIELFRDEVVRIKAGFIGNTELEFVPGPKKPVHRVRIQPGDLLAGSVAVDPLQAFANLESTLNQAAGSLSDAGDEVSKLAKNLNDLLSSKDEQVGRIIDETETTMKLFQKTLVDLDDIVGDEKSKADLKQAIGELPQVLGEMREALTGVQKTVALADDNLRNMQTFTKALDEQGEGMINNAASSIERLDELLSQTNRFTRALNSREGSLGQMINNPELYNNLSQAAANINRLTRELQPVIADARVLTDKMARHPGVILTDAVKPGPGIK